MFHVMLEGIGTTRIASGEGINAEGHTLKQILAVVAGGLFSGAERVLLRDLLSAQQRGWQVRIACSDGPLLDQMRAHGIEHVTIPDLRLPDKPAVIAFPVLAFRALRASQTLRSTLRPQEVCLANSVNALAIIRLLARSTPVVYFAHDVLVRRDRILLLRLAAKRISVAIAVSEWVAHGLRSLDVRTETVRNGTPLGGALATPNSEAAPIIGIAGLLTPWKGQHVVLDALALVKNQDTQLEIMGGKLPKDSAYLTQLRAQVDRLGLRTRVRFLGHTADPIEVMRRWTIAISASTDPEGGPLVAIEAMSIGVPVIASNHGGVTELLGTAGELVTPGDPAAFAQAIDAMLDDPAKWKHHSRSGPEILSRLDLSVESQSAHFLDVIDSASV